MINFLKFENNTNIKFIAEIYILVHHANIFFSQFAPGLSCNAIHLAVLVFIQFCVPDVLRILLAFLSKTEVIRFISASSISGGPSVGICSMESSPMWGCRADVDVLGGVVELSEISSRASNSSPLVVLVTRRRRFLMCEKIGVHLSKEWKIFVWKLFDFGWKIVRNCGKFVKFWNLKLKKT